MNTYIAFYVAWACLLGALPVSVGVFVVLRKQAPGLHQHIFRLCVLVVLTTSAFVASDIRFKGLAINTVSLALGYVSFCYLVVSAWGIRNKVARIMAIFVGGIPIASGYVLGTIGVLGLMFIVGDQTEPPLRTERITANLNCEVTGWGMAVVASDSGYTVHLYKNWLLLPLVEREVAKMVVNETHPVEGVSEATCQSVYATYVQSKKL
jgi:hypothetical protein